MRTHTDVFLSITLHLITFCLDSGLQRGTNSIQCDRFCPQATTSLIPNLRDVTWRNPTGTSFSGITASRFGIDIRV